MNIDNSPAMKLNKNPIITPLGANGKTAGQSRAGFASLTTLSAIPLKAGTISAINIPNPGKNDINPSSKGNSLDEREYDKVLPAAQFSFYISFARNWSDNQE